MSSRELKTSKFSLMLRTRENCDVFNSLEIYLVLTSKKQISSMRPEKGFCQLHSYHAAGLLLCLGISENILLMMLLVLPAFRMNYFCFLLLCYVLKHLSENICV